MKHKCFLFNENTQEVGGGDFQNKSLRHTDAEVNKSVYYWKKLLF